MDQEINQLQTAINNGWLPDDIRDSMTENQHIAQVTVEAEPTITQQVEVGRDKEDNPITEQQEIERIAIVYSLPNGDDTTTKHRSLYQGDEIKRLLKAAQNA